MDVWPGITRDPSMPIRIRELGAWIDSVEKVVFSTTLESTEWEKLKADLVDDLRMAIVPTVVGGGLPLLPEGLPAKVWELAATTTLAHGAVGLHYRRT